jgi:hypothetical protein
MGHRWKGGTNGRTQVEGEDNCWDTNGRRGKLVGHRWKGGTNGRTQVEGEDNCWDTGGRENYW